MNTNAPSDKIQTTSNALSWLVGYAVTAMVIFFIAFIRSNSSARNGGHGPLEHFASGAGPFLGFSILAATAVASVLCIVGFARCPAQAIRSPRWVLSAIGIVLVTAVALLTVFLAAFIAVQNP